MPTTTSLHTINSDRELSYLKKSLYLIANWLNNAFPNQGVAQNLALLPFRPPITDQIWNTLPAKSSPSRRLSDLFWINLPWADIQTKLGQINILDIGCGSGRYGENLATWSQNRIASYTGIDTATHPNWSKLSERHPNFRFHVGSAHTINQLIPAGTNFIMSQSAIEHIDHDLLFFQHLRDYVKKCGHPVMQVHLFPSAACLKLYVLHGIRQYTPRTVSKIARLFPSAACELSELGGPNCNQLHWNFITKPGLLRRPDRRETETKQYIENLRQAILSDFKEPLGQPAFYALKII